MQEIWDVYDENRNKTGEIIYRENYEPKGYHLVVHIWIRNSKGEWLISKRTANKHCPLLWECTGGSVLAGEESIDGALREVREELGISLDKSKGFVFTSYRRDNYLDFCDVWVFEHDCDIEDVTLQEDETCDAMWASGNKILSLIDNNQFIPLDNLKYAYQLIKFSPQKPIKDLIEEHK